MTGRPSARQRLVTGLAVACGVIFPAAFYGCGSEDAPGERRSHDIEATESGEVAPLPGVRVNAGAGPRAARRTTEGCEPAEESRKYEGFVGERALATLQWTGMSEDAASLEIPVYVVGIEDGTIGVRFLQFPMREQYLHIWLGSGHITAAPENLFLLGPCSARLAPSTDATREPPTDHGTD